MRKKEKREKEKKRERERERRKDRRRSEGEEADMDDKVQNGVEAEQWLPMLEKGEKRASSVGSGAFRFIRTRTSIRRELKRQCNR